jgi:hypothetical protein
MIVVRAWRFAWRLSVYLWFEMIGASVILVAVWALVATDEGFVGSVVGALLLTAIGLPVFAVLAVLLSAVRTSAIAARRRT